MNDVDIFRTIICESLEGAFPGIIITPETIYGQLRLISMPEWNNCFWYVCTEKDKMILHIFSFDKVQNKFCLSVTYTAKYIHRN